MFGKRGKKFSLFKHVWTGLKFRSTTRNDSLITLHVLLYYHLVRGSFFFVHCKAKNTVQLSVSHSKSLSFLIGLLDHRGSLPKTSPKVSPITMSFEYKLVWLRHSNKAIIKVITNTRNNKYLGDDSPYPLLWILVSCTICHVIDGYRQPWSFETYPNEHHLKGTCHIDQKITMRILLH